MDPTGKFTLVELLVVIGIITVLGIMLATPLANKKATLQHGRGVTIGRNATDFQVESGNITADDLAAFRLTSDDEQETLFQFWERNGEYQKQVELVESGNKILAISAAQVGFQANDLAGLLLGVGEVTTALKAVEVQQYALVATRDGFYPVMKWGFKAPQEGVWLKAGDVWKYGTTKNPATRYPQDFLIRWGLRMDKQFSGTLSEALAAEKAQILKYKELYGKLPPGNKIVR